MTPYRKISADVMNNPLNRPWNRSLRSSVEPMDLRWNTLGRREPWRTWTNKVSKRWSPPRYNSKSVKLASTLPMDLSMMVPSNIL